MRIIRIKEFLVARFCTDLHRFIGERDIDLAMILSIFCNCSGRHTVLDSTACAGTVVSPYSNFRRMRTIICATHGKHTVCTVSTYILSDESITGSDHKTHYLLSLQPCGICSGMNHIRTLIRKNHICSRTAFVTGTPEACRLVTGQRRYDYALAFTINICTPVLERGIGNPENSFSSKGKDFTGLETVSKSDILIDSTRFKAGKHDSEGCYSRTRTFVHACRATRRSSGSRRGISGSPFLSALLAVFDTEVGCIGCIKLCRQSRRSRTDSHRI